MPLTHLVARHATIAPLIHYDPITLFHGSASPWNDDTGLCTYTSGEALWWRIDMWQENAENIGEVTTLPVTRQNSTQFSGERDYQSGTPRDPSAPRGYRFNAGTTLGQCWPYVKGIASTCTQH